MTERDDDVWNKMAVPTLDTLLESLIELRRREKIEEWRIDQPHHWMKNTGNASKPTSI